MPRILIKRATEQLVQPSNDLPLTLHVRYFGAGMPAGRPTDESTVNVTVQAGQTLAQNKAAIRAAIVADARAQGINMANDAQINTLEEFLQSL